MSADKPVNKWWKRTSRYRFILLMSVAALVSISVPLQIWISLSRYQHIGISVFLFGMGYIMQLIWSYKIFSHWARISNFATGLFFCSVGMVFYANPWLAAVGTPEKETTRYLLISAYIFLALVIAALWLKWIHEDNKRLDKGLPNDKAGQ